MRIETLKVYGWDILGALGGRTSTLLRCGIVPCTVPSKTFCFRCSPEPFLFLFLLCVCVSVGSSKAPGRAMSRLADHLAFKGCQIFKSEIPSGGTSAVSLWSQSLSEPTLLSSGDAVAWLLMEWGGGLQHWPWNCLRGSWGLVLIGALLAFVNLQ